MCDTVVALNNSAHNGSVIYGKNSNREKDEPNIIVHISKSIRKELS